MVAARRRRPSPSEFICGYCGGAVGREGLLLRLEDGLWSGFDSWSCLVRFASCELHPSSPRAAGGEDVIPRLPTIRGRHLWSVPGD